MNPGEHKTVQARILAYAENVGWTFVSRKEAEQRRAGFPTRHAGKKADRNVRAPLSLFFYDLLDVKVRKINPCYAEAKEALLGKFRHFHTDIYGNWEKSFDHEEKHERDLILIDCEEMTYMEER